MENTQTITIEQFISKHGIKFEYRRVEARPDGLMEKSERHFRCRITQPKPDVQKHGTPQANWFGGSFGLYFSQGSAHTADPTLADVLDCLASDASGYETAKDSSGISKQGTRYRHEIPFESWCAEYGYDPDSRKAEKTFRAIKRQSEQLKRTIGQAAYEELRYNVERL